MGYCFKMVAALRARFLHSGVRQHQANAVLEKRLKMQYLLCVGCLLGMNLMLSERISQKGLGWEGP